MAKRKLLVALGDDEDHLLIRIAAYTGVSQAKLVRWAIRFYGLQGPWTLQGRKRRAEAIGDLGPMEVGPMFQEVMQ